MILSLSAVASPNDQSLPIPTTVLHSATLWPFCLHPSDFAAHFQHVYVRVTMFSVGGHQRLQQALLSSRSSSHSRSRSPAARARYPYPPRCLESGLRPEGYRACLVDIYIFTDADVCGDEKAPRYQPPVPPSPGEPRGGRGAVFGVSLVARFGSVPTPHHADGP